MCSTQEEELSQLYKMNDELKSRVLELAEENQELSKDKTNLQTELADTRTKLTEKLDELNAERARLDAEIQRFDATEKNLTLQVWSSTLFCSYSHQLIWILCLVSSANS